MKGAALLLLAALTAPALGEGAQDWRLTHNIGGVEARTGATPGMTGTEAVYFQGVCCGGGALAERKIPLEAWRGKRVRVSLRFRNEGKLARADLWLRIDGGERAISTVSQSLRGEHWQTPQFVLDVPGDAISLAVDLSLSGRGASWLDGVALEPVSADVPVTPVRPRNTTSGGFYAYGWDWCCGDPGPYYQMGPAPVPVAVDIAPAGK